MENLLELETETSARWREWEEKGERHDKAIARKVKWVARVVIGLLVLAGALYSFYGK